MLVIAVVLALLVLHAFLLQKPGADFSILPLIKNFIVLRFVTTVPSPATYSITSPTSPLPIMSVSEIRTMPEGTTLQARCPATSINKHRTSLLDLPTELRIMVCKHVYDTGGEKALLHPLLHVSHHLRQEYIHAFSGHICLHISGEIMSRQKLGSYKEEGAPATEKSYFMITRDNGPSLNVTARAAPYNNTLHRKSFQTHLSYVWPEVRTANPYAGAEFRDSTNTGEETYHSFGRSPYVWVLQHLRRVTLDYFYMYPCISYEVICKPKFEITPSVQLFGCLTDSISRAEKQKVLGFAEKNLVKWRRNEVEHMDEEQDQSFVPDYTWISGFVDDMNAWELSDGMSGIPGTRHWATVKSAP